MRLAANLAVSVLSWRIVAYMCTTFITSNLGYGCVYASANVRHT